jgi:hypothetical protein
VPNVLTPLEKFHHRCQVRAVLWQIGELELHAATDDLEALARELAIDADIAQAMMAQAFAAVRDDLGGWRP